MAEASIPVDLFNPGQVFGCLGFLEAADVLLGDAEGGFDWSDQAQVRFHLRAAGDENPFAIVLRFLSSVEIRRCVPVGYEDASFKEEAPIEDGTDGDNSVPADHLFISESFPDRKGDRMALPIRLELRGGPSVDLSHWTDGSSRHEFKLYAGNRSAYSIACAMIRGTHEKPKKKQSVGDVKTLGIAALWDREPADLAARPFDVLTSMGGSFNFDPRGGWTALDAGYSPNEHAGHGVAGSPVVEILSVWGLEHARPDEFERRHVRYGAWSGFVPPVLARPALAGASAGVAIRRFQFGLQMSGKNKVVTFAREERNT